VRARRHDRRRVAVGDVDSHLPRRRFDLDLVWWDEFWLELAAPLDGALNALERIVNFPLGCAHIACDCIWPIKPSAFPRCIGIIVGEAKRVGILKVTKGEMRFEGRGRERFQR
jgi:hypothetical protein